MGQYNPKNLRSTLFFMWRKCGPQIFQNPSRMYSALCDLSPALRDEWNILRLLGNSGVLTEAAQAALDADEEALTRAVMKVRSWLLDHLFMREDKANEFQEAISALYGVQPLESGGEMEAAAEMEADSETESDARTPEKEAGQSKERYFAPLAEDSIVASGQTGDLSWEFDVNGLLTLSGKGEMENYDYDNDTDTVHSPWQDFRGGITALTIEKGVSMIGAWAFHGCENLQSISIPDSVVTIGKHAFSDCGNLYAVAFPDSVKKIEGYAFAACKSLQSVSIPKSVSAAEAGVFFHCDGLESVSIPNSITSIEQFAFAYCKSLQSVVIPNSVTRIVWRAFFGCENLQSVSIPDSVASIGAWAFQNCGNLRLISVPQKTVIEPRAFPSVTKVKRR